MAHEAAEFCRHPEKQISLLLTDLAMPRKNGFELARELKALWPGLPIISSRAIFEWDSSLGIVACMQKPFTPAALLAEVARMLSGQSPKRKTSGDYYLNRPSYPLITALIQTLRPS